MFRLFTAGIPNQFGQTSQLLHIARRTIDPLPHNMNFLLLSKHIMGVVEFVSAPKRDGRSSVTVLQTQTLTQNK